MSLTKVILILIFLKLHFYRIQSKETETTCLINGRKSINVVNKRFLSFSIDPEMILTGFNLSSTSIKLAQHLSPAFMRIAGPSTEFIQLSEDENALMSFFKGTSNFTVTPMMWKSLNYWIKNANLTPVFGISDKNRTNRVWNPNSILPLLDISEKMNFTCYWQLGYDCKDKSIMRYKQDLLTLKQALDEHPSNRKYWKIVGSDLQSCFSRTNPELARKTLEYLNDVTDAIIWQEQIGKHPTHFTKTPIPVWLVVPKLTHPTTFSSGLLWAKQIGDAAKAGYEVIFRQPSLQELSIDTPVYWISLIYKSLMGQNVLEVRTNSIPEPEINIYAHCTKNQNNYSKRGAVTIFVVNNSTFKRTTSLRVATSHPGSIEVQSYIITSDGEDSANTYFNGKKCSLDNLQDGQFKFLPKRRRVRVNKLLNLVSPSNSIAFFVLPAAQIPVCIQREDETHLLMEKLDRDQNDNFSVYHEEVDVKLIPQIPHEYNNKKDLNLDESYHLIDPDSNEKSHQQKHSNELKKQIQSLRKTNPKNLVRNPQIVKEFRQYLINKLKTMREDDNRTTKLEIIFRERPAKNQTIPSHIKIVELELTSDEIKKILKDRAKSKVAENNIDITSQELENILKEAPAKVVNNEDTTMAALRKRKRFAVPNVSRKVNSKVKKIMKNRQRPKRDINMELLDLKTAREKPVSKIMPTINQQIEATIRKVGETSEELLKDIEKSSEERRGDVFAELASLDSELYNHEDFKQPFGGKTHLGDLLNPTKQISKESLCPEAKYLDERVKFLMEPSGIEPFIEEDLKNYHDFQENLRFQKKVNPQPKLNNEIRNINKFTQVSDGAMHDLPSSNTIRPQVNMEIGEWDILSRGNHGKASSEPVRSSINNEMWEMNPFTQVSDGRIHALPSSNMVRPQNNMEIGEWDILSRGNHGKASSEPVRSSTNNEMWEMNPFTQGSDGRMHALPSSNTVRLQNKMEIGEWDIVSKGNYGKAPSEIVRSTNNEMWEVNPFTQVSDGGIHDLPSFNTVKPQVNMEIGEWDLLSKGNHGKASSEVVRSSINNKMWEMNPFTQVSDGGIRDLPSSNTVRPQVNMNIGEWDVSSRGNPGKVSSEVVKSSLNNKMWELNPFTQVSDGGIRDLPSSNTVKPQVNMNIGEWDVLSRGNPAKVSSDDVRSSLNNEMVTPQLGEVWEMDSFPQRNGIATENPSKSNAATPRFNIMWKTNEISQEKNKNMKNPSSELTELGANIPTWQINTSSEENNGKVENPALYITARPQFNKVMEKWDTVSVRNNKKQENPSSPKMEINGENIVKPQRSKEVWAMDIFSHKGDGKIQSLVSSEAVTIQPNIKILEINGFPQEIVEKPENPFLWETDMLFNTEEPQFNIEMEKWDTLSKPNDENIENSFLTEMVDRGINNQMMDVNTFSESNNEKLENLSSADIVRPYTGKQTWGTNTFSQENNEKTEDPTSRQPDKEVSIMDKSFSDLSETAPSPKMVSEDNLKDLENYFCNPKNGNNEPKIKFKRDVSIVTKDDIKNYKKFMMEQLQAIRKARQSKFHASEVPSKNVISKARPKLSPSLDSKDDDLSSNGEHLHIVIGKPYDPEKLHINERRRAKQIKKLKQRLQNRKKLNEKIRERKLHQNEVADDNLSSRRKRTPYNIKTNEVSEKKQNWNGAEKYYNYKRRIFHPKTWKPQDIFKVKKVPSYSVEVVDKREFLQRTAPFNKNKFTETKRHRRSVGNGIDSSENTIYDDSIIKNKKIKNSFTDDKNNNFYKKLNLPSRMFAQEWNEIKTTTEETNEINPDRSIKTTVTFEDVIIPSTYPDGVTSGKTDGFLYDQTQKPQEKEKEEVINTEIMDSVIPPHFIDMIMDAVNTTVSSFVHLGEKISQQFSF